MVEGSYIGVSLRVLKTPFLDYVDAGVDYQAGEHDQCGEAALVEGTARDGEDEEAADEGYGDQADDGQRQQEGLEEDGTDEIDDGNYQQYKQHILPLVVIPAILGFLGIIADRENFFIEAFDFGVNDFLRKVGVADEFPGNGQGVLMVEAVDVVSAMAALDGADPGETQRPAADVEILVPEVPYVERCAPVGYQVHAQDLIAHGNCPHLCGKQRIAQAGVGVRPGKSMRGKRIGIPYQDKLICRERTPPSDFSVDVGLADARVTAKPFHGGAAVPVEIVVIVACHDDALSLVGGRHHVVAESLVVDAIDAPGGTAQVGSLGHDLGLELQRESCLLGLRLEIHHDGSVAVPGYGSTEGLYLFELCEIVLHGEHHFVELCSRASVRQ